MLKRVFWLFFLCLAFCLLLTLAVEQTDDLIKAPPRIQAFYALPARHSLEPVEAGMASPVIRVSHADTSPNPLLSRQNPGIIIPDKPFHLQNYFAFDYKTEAG